MKKCLLFHNYESVRDTGFTVYLRCRRCKRRIVLQGRGRYQLIDQTWLDTGEWAKLGKPPNVGTSVTLSRAIPADATAIRNEQGAIIGWGWEVVP